MGTDWEEARLYFLIGQRLGGYFFLLYSTVKQTVEAGCAVGAAGEAKLPPCREAQSLPDLPQQIVTSAMPSLPRQYRESLGFQA